MRQRRVPLFLAMLLVAGAAAPAWAGDPRVVVMSVDGDRRGTLEDVLSKIVGSEYEVITAGEFGDAAQDARVDPAELDLNGLAKLAKRLDAAALVEGKLSKKGGKHTLTVWVRAGDTGKARKFSVAIGTARLDDGQVDQIGEVLLRYLKKTTALARDRARAEDAQARAEDAEDEKAVGRRGRLALSSRADALASEGEDRDRGDGDGEWQDGGEEDGQIRRRHFGRSAANAGIRLEVGPSVQVRTLAFSNRADLTEDQDADGLRTAPVGGGHIAAEVYPGALLGARGLAAGIGVSGAYDQSASFAVESRASDPMLPPTLHAVSQKRWEVALSYRHVFGNTASAPSLTVAAGYGRRQFSINQDGLMAGELPPNVDYRSFNPGLAFRLPLGARLAISASGRAMLVRAAGQIQAREQYGTASITGIDAAGGLEVMVTRRAVLRLAGTFTQLGYKFEGNGEKANARDLDATTIDVGGARDRYVGGTLTVGLVY